MIPTVAVKTKATKIVWYKSDSNVVELRLDPKPYIYYRIGLVSGINKDLRSLPGYLQQQEDGKG